MKRLSALFATCKHYIECRIPQFYDPWIEHLSLDSRSLEANSLFFALPGQHYDGHDFIDKAIQAGAVAIVHEKELSSYNSTLAYLRVADSRATLSELVASYYDEVQNTLTLIGVTGTDGKTTTSYFLYQLLQAEGVRCGLMTTVLFDDGTALKPSPYPLSTPEAPQLFAFLSHCHANGLTHVVLEASSHGLSSSCSRLSKCTFSWALLTSFTSDHLDFHINLNNYFDAKLNLVRQLTPTGQLICSANFPRLSEIENLLGAKDRLLTYQIDETNPNATLSVTTASTSLLEQHVWVDSELVSFPFGPQIYLRNALTALLAASAILKIPVTKLAQRCSQLKPVEGRYQIISTALPLTIIVDFAHTVAAYQELFEHLKRHAGGAPLVALIGAAGERDRSKRPQLGAIAATYCQALFITDEDPRSEEPQAILEEIASGVSKTSQAELFLIGNRRLAIEEALRYCPVGAILLALGKGHEKRIIYHDHSIPWDEQAVIIELAEKVAQEALRYES